jgi:hypothetical protein
MNAANEFAVTKRSLANTVDEPSCQVGKPEFLLPLLPSLTLANERKHSQPYNGNEKPCERSDGSWAS